MASKVPKAKSEAVARARVLETQDHRFIVETMLATSIVEERRMHLLIARILKDIGKAECETLAMDELDVDFAYRKLDVKENNPKLLDFR